MPLLVHMKPPKVKKISGSLYDFCSCPTGEENALLLFFHSMALDQQTEDETTDHIPFTTWSYDGSDLSKGCWPSEQFSEDPDMIASKIKVRALAAVYDPSKYKTHNRARLDIYNVAENFVQEIIPELVKRKQSSGQGVPIIFVAHSFGGFVAQNLIDHGLRKLRISGQSKQKENLQKFFENFGGVFFYATPHKALSRATYELFFPKKIPAAKGKEYSEFVKLLETHNKHLARNGFAANLNVIQRDFRNGQAVQVKTIYEQNETKSRDGTCVIVDEASAYAVSNNEVASVEADHFTICKLSSDPSDKFTQSKYTFLRQFIKNVLDA
ncbi:hypothetical protein Mapa_002410 [Marchantia paleacea]|nr:hypothetical protein Mapa_002410 [Marchantia paleacea]